METRIHVSIKESQSVVQTSETARASENIYMPPPPSFQSLNVFGCLIRK